MRQRPRWLLSQPQESAQFRWPAALSRKCQPSRRQVAHPRNRRVQSTRCPIGSLDVEASWLTWSQQRWWAGSRAGFAHVDHACVVRHDHRRGFAACRRAEVENSTRNTTGLGCDFASGRTPGNSLFRALALAAKLGRKTNVNPFCKPRPLARLRTVGLRR